ncbi:amino acid permease [Mycobacterium persicum]|uniref:D-serine/D-alanine/glycine transporter n=1 Tax=Mycobacterium persicum TaxID=1487726 RepID=A0A1X0LBV5_9MYCO|nr:amino acid permease [Mycobacterium persicum]KZS84122.1 D-serine/D-alanine/glycine transporter [Mycobacterium persicum]ORB59066.1 D-serine/D-alanine/glycine transporter [Mycobacterium persicum]ORB91041.1 D-serine/D-alanine/glycine transporter [Mycobacterium persicum]ORB94552.1 D-serine/D-alanine/glycine transporter [Mycobacterium persicum]ORC01274.1 D-serine/D-alanine/glycine transporter [Mycobacterium persicum]
MSSDIGTHHTDDHAPHLHRGLSNRHVQLIAIGGAIGTGLFMGSGRTISLAGPAVMLVYGIIGFFAFFVLRAMGELLLSNLRYKSFVDCAADLLGPAAGYLMGWSYWFAWIVTGVADLVAITGYAMFWWPDLPRWLPAVVAIGLILTINLFGVSKFGETEFWFALIKVVAILCLVIIGAILVAGHFVSPDGDRAAFENLWNDGGFFATGFMGVVSGFQIGFFAYIGVELVGTAAAETADPQRTLPRAINAVPLRVAIFYVGALLAILTVVPWRRFASGESPFVAMFSLAGLAAAASFVNFVVITSAASSANSGVFSTGRMLYGLADEGNAPALFARLNRRGVPAPALLLTAALLLTTIPLLYAGGTVIGAFTVITTVSSTLFMFVWTMIIISYLVYRRRHPQRHADSRYKMPGGVAMCWAVLVFFAFVIWTLTTKPETATALAWIPVWFVILAVSWLFVRRRPSRVEQYLRFQVEMNGDLVGTPAQVARDQYS